MEATACMYRERENRITYDEHQQIMKQNHVCIIHIILFKDQPERAVPLTAVNETTVNVARVK